MNRHGLLQTTENAAAFESLIHQAHSSSRSTVQEISKDLGMNSLYLRRVIEARSRPTRDLLLVICLRNWMLDTLETDEILSAASFAPLLDPVGDD